MITAYPFAGREEYCLAITKGRTNTVMLVAPLFEEANRTRRTLVQVMRCLDQRGVDTILPDLPSRNESTAPAATMDFAHWQAALNGCAAHFGAIAHVAALRGGCLLDHVSGAQNVWRLAPLKGAQIIRNLLRTRIASDREDGRDIKSADLMAMAKADGAMLAGNWLSANMVTQLDAAVPANDLAIREVHAGPVADFDDSCITASPLWLRAEPDYDAAMAQAIAADIARWIG